MKKYFALTGLTALVLCSAMQAAESPPSFGIVNFGACVSDSKLGQQEQGSFDQLKVQMAGQVEDTEKQINELTAKFNDPDYIDGLSPEAENELKMKFRSLNETLNYQQNQYYQVMNQANMQVIQTLSSSINAASEKIAKEKKLAVILNKDACFYVSDALDVTKNIISEMDKTFIAEAKKTEGTESSTSEIKNTKTK